MRLIDADKLYPDCLTKYGRLAISDSQIANAPTIEEPKRPKGEWILNKDENPECPFCHHSFTYWGNFCGNCGADMR